MMSPLIETTYNHSEFRSGRIMSQISGNHLAMALGMFNSISLSESHNARLMNRIDTKYWFCISQLPGILNDISFHYNLLEINGKTVQVYRTHYYDTPLDSYYLDHQNERPNRIKVRKREYVGSRLRFLEVKRKNPKGTTLKKRIPVDTVSPHFCNEELCFLNQQVYELPSVLEETVCNQFNRITLVNHNMQERCTIDFDIQFSRGNLQSRLKKIVIIELKQINRSVSSPLQQALHSRHIHSNGFSKYCVGRAILQPGIKQNRLKPTLLKIQKHEIN